MNQEYPFPKPVNKSVLICSNYSRPYPDYEWKQAPQDPVKKYYLSSDNQIIDWKEADFPDGEELGQILYWDPTAGQNQEGAWVLTDAPQELGQFFYWDPTARTWVLIDAPSENEPERFFYWNQSEYAFAEVKEFQVCENGELKTYKIPAIEVL